MPNWPPVSGQFEDKLKEHKLNCVSKEEFKITPDVDSRGFTKTYEIPGYAGIFRLPEVYYKLTI